MFRKLALAILLATTPLSLAADVKGVGLALMCICGCNQVLGTCHHPGGQICPTSGGMIKEVEREVASGKTDEEVLAHFAEKYGMAVLAASPVSGFNLAAWLMPFAALLIGTVVAVHFIRRFSRDSPLAAAPSEGVDTAKYQRQIEEELKKYTPED